MLSANGQVAEERSGISGEDRRERRQAWRACPGSEVIPGRSFRHRPQSGSRPVVQASKGIENLGFSSPGSAQFWCQLVFDFGAPRC
jgi:hypothetical protein